MSGKLFMGLFLIVAALPYVWSQNTGKPETADKAEEELSVVSLPDTIVKIPEVKRKTPNAFVMKELLKALPQKARSEFIGSFMLKDGRIATLNSKPLKAVLSSELITGILNNLGSSRESLEKAKKYKSGNPPRVTVLSELFKDVPEEARDHFFDNMMFKDGGVACVDVGRLKKAVSKRQLIKILNSLAPVGGKRPQIYPKVLCGDGWCEESVCSSIGGKWHCRFNENQDTICYDWCEDLP
ncbi:MAG: hypothetical protein FD189_1545 [Elusimicrobia bacterium]|nr:MAG: hypothetical protein FD154_886 [Elusimicrobiota bacterium]KAF0155112.1 MAG: hypothetical protein FD189_1545 [Elusimicrobiota bacterium]